MMVHGWLVVDKPKGCTSTQVGSRLKRVLRRPKIGHAGTLDPFATGVLPLAIGEATKSMPYVMLQTKSYRFDLCFGEQRDSDDETGCVLATTSHLPTEHDIRQVLGKFQGEISQVPPIYSAIHVDGERSYHRARRGEIPVLPSRTVTIHTLVYEEQVDATTHRLFVSCSTGTYVRALGRDIAEELQSLGYLKALRRTRVGIFTLDMAKTLESLLEMAYEELTELCLPIRSVLDDIPAVPVSGEQIQKIRHGQAIFLGPALYRTPTLLLIGESCEIAIATYKDGWVQPVRVFNLNK